MLKQFCIAFLVLFQLSGTRGQDIVSANELKADKVVKGRCDQTDWQWFVGKELRVVVDSLLLDSSFVEIHPMDDGQPTRCFFYSWLAPKTARVVVVTMDNWVDLSYLFIERNDARKILHAIKVDTVREVSCSDHEPTQETETR